MASLETLVPDSGVPLATRLHLPARSADSDAQGAPAVVVAGSWLTVKEQMADTYATRLAELGYASVTFDFAGFGASGGDLRQTEIPVRKIGNLAAVVDWVRMLSGIDRERVAILGICASAQYALGALARGLPVSSFASVAGWFHDCSTVAPFYGGEPGVRERLERSATALERYAADGGLSLVSAYDPDDDRSAMNLPMDYYANPDRGRVPTWRIEMSELSWAHWLTYDALSLAAEVRVPTLVVHSDDAVLPDNARAVADRMVGPVTVEWTSGAQTDFYDRPAQVDRAVALADAHFRAHRRTS